LAAGEIVGNWPEGLHRFLNQFRNREKPDNSSISLGFRFRLLLHDAAQLENLGYATPAQAIRDYLADDMAVGHLGPKVLLFKQAAEDSQLRRRDWITQTETARRLNVRNPSVRRLIEQGILSGQVQTTTKSGRTVAVASRKSVQDLEQELSSALDVPTVAKRLAVGPHAVLSMIHDGVLTGLLRPARRGLNSLLVCRVDVETSMPKILQQRDEAEGVPIHRLAKTLFPARTVKVDVLKKWIAMGFLVAKRVGRTRVVSTEEIRQFHDTFCLADEACRRIGITRKTLSTWERLGCIVPVYGRRVTPDAGFSLFRLEDVARLVQWRTEKGRRIPPRIHTSR
jgi:DNA-binding XRE family transcriptional regulator